MQSYPASSYVTYAELSSLLGAESHVLFTVNLLERRQDTLVSHIEVLREAVRKTRQELSFHIDAWFVLPDHMHSTVWIQEVGHQQ